MSLQYDTSGYLKQEILRNTRYLLVTVDKNGLVTRQQCPGSNWRMEGVTTGSKLPDDLHGIINASTDTAKPSLFPYVQLTDKLIADVHVLGDEDNRQLILKDVSSVHDVECKLQQKAHEVSLLHEQTAELNRQLAKRRLEAVEASEAKSRFIAAMSHEFRSPINSIMGNAEMLANTSTGPNGVAAIQRASWHLLTLVENLLEQAQSGDGILQLNIAPVDISEIFSAMHELFDVQIQTNGPEFKLDLRCESPGFFSDEHRLRQVLINLISNAVRYTDSGEILVVCAAEAGRLQFTVSDTGKGIARQDQERIFKPFVRATETEGGAGLGLAISQQLVKALGGELKLESEPGVGSIFSFSLPMSLAADLKPDLDLTGVSVLLVEDDNDLRQMYSIFLQDWGMQVNAVAGFQSAVEAFTAHPTDIIMSDLRLVDGLGSLLLEELRKINPNSGTILCSGYLEDSGRGDTDCVDHFVTKPISADYLKSIIVKTITAKNL